MTKKIVLISFIFSISLVSFSQGLINNGARIVFSGGAQIYIDGANGNYTNQLAGLITPSSTSSISLAGNWINNSSPANVAFSADGGGVALTGATQSVGGSNPTAFHNLSLTGAGLKTLAVNQSTVGGQSANTGVLALVSSTLNLNSNTLNVTNAATSAITRVSGYVISETNSATNPSTIKWYHRTVTGSRIYPFGVAGSYIPFTLNITAATALLSTSYVEVSTRATASNNTPWASGVSHMYSPNVPYADGSIPAVIDRWWQINNSDAITANTTFSYRGSENTLNALYSSGVIGAQYWAGGWLPNNAVLGSAAVVNSGVGSVTSSFVNTGSGPWVLSALNSPLPIELLNFEAQCVNNTIVLNWCTASEKNNDYFTVEQSVNGTDFISINKIYGSGTTEQKHCYNFTVSKIGDQNYFRLKQTDKNGQSTTSKIAFIEACGKTESPILLANNGTNQVGVILNSLTNQHLQLIVHNALGQLIETKPIETSIGYNNLTVSLDNLSNAFYYVSVYNGTEKLVSKKIVVSDIR